jgi:hypothetical protein
MEALVGGVRDPKRLAELAPGRPRVKTAALEEALDGADTFTDHHAFVLRMMLDNIDRLTAQIENLSAPFEGQVVQLDQITGVGRTGPQDLIGEIGVDMSAFATAAHLVSWAEYCPQVKRSAGKRKGRNATGSGNRYIAGMLGEASVTTGRTQTRLGARYRRLAKPRGKAKAQVAVGNTTLTIAQPGRRLPRPRSRLLRDQDASPSPGSQSPPRSSASRLQGHSRARRRRGRLTEPTATPQTASSPRENPAPLTLRRMLPPAQLTSRFRARHHGGSSPIDCRGAYWKCGQPRRRIAAAVGSGPRGPP